MQGGDISNEVPKRIAVMESILLQTPDETKSSRWRRPRVAQAVAALDINKSMVARIWQFSRRQGISWELAIIGRPDGWGDELIERLDAIGMTGIARTLVYPTVAEFARDIAWRSYLVGVVAEPEQRLMFGSAYIDPGRVA